MFLRFFGWVGILLSPLLATAQLSFPNGKEVNLVTDNDFLYMETRLIFGLGKHKAEDYYWKRIKDSTDSRWLLGSCFNGDCWNGLPDSSTFIGEYGIHDTACFIAFHVETYGFTGKSMIQYRVTNKYDPSITADLTFNVEYNAPAGIEEPEAILFHLYPNPAKKVIHLSGTSVDSYVEITSIMGKIVLSEQLGSSQQTIDISTLQPGLYFIRLKDQSGQKGQKFIISR